MRRKTLGMKIFTVFNYAFLTLLAISCLLPMLNQLAISFSSSSAVAAGGGGAPSGGFHAGFLQIYGG